MKKILSILCFGALLMGSVACNKQLEGDGSMSSLTIEWDASGTKGAATDGEKALTSLYVYVFDSHGMLDVSQDCTANIAAASVTINVKTGSKTVFALANPSASVLANANAVTTLDEFNAITFDLSDNATSRTAFLMYGSNTVNVQTSGNNPCPITLTRPIAKVTLGTITNNLPSPYGNIQLVRTFLCNVVGNDNVTRNAAASTWYNMRATDNNAAANRVIGTGTYVANQADFTYRGGLSTDIVLNNSAAANQVMYAGRNNNTNIPAGFTNPFTPSATVLMVVLKIKNIEYYYPVALTGGRASNTDYLVNLTVKGLGNTLEDGPMTKIEKANITATIAISEWSDSTPYNETI